jgi:hypothetical protein
LLGDEIADLLGVPKTDYWDFSWVRIIQSRNFLQTIFPDRQAKQNTQIKQMFEKKGAQISLTFNPIN